MRRAEYEKLASVFEKDERFVPTPRKTSDAVYSVPQQLHSDAKCYLLVKSLKPWKVAEQSLTLGECLSNVLKSIPKDFKQFYCNYTNIVSQNRKIAVICARELKRSLSKTSKTNPSLKSKRINKELNCVIKRSSREEREKIKKEEKKEGARKKREEEVKEELRQKRKFNYLMSQTEAFANFFLNKKRRVDEGATEENSKAMKAAHDQLAHLKEFDDSKGKVISEAYEYQQVRQPDILKAGLKEYQLKGLNWLVNLYNQGINGILADDMGLGKTVQSISLLAHLAEVEDVWGPFLIVTPSSTLHNWANEFSKFLPVFRVLNYWGGLQERKELRKRLKRVNVVITSYQIAVSDESVISRIKWQYMILDEAQAIKSINSQRWRILLGFKSRNRLLLTGTPIQNNMQELWSLLHFIMPTLFDSLAEFSEWFSKDIENRARVEDEQISKLHTILKPFMLRRHKNDIKDEIGSKEIVNVICEMSNRQKVLYSDVVESRMDYENTLMQLKKVCNHPDLFEKLEPCAALSMSVSGGNGFVGFRSFIKKFICKELLRPREMLEEGTEDLLYLSCQGMGARRLFGVDDSSVRAVPCKRDLRIQQARSFTDAASMPTESAPAFDDIFRRRTAIEIGIKRFKFLTEKVLDKHITTNVDRAEHVSISKIDRLTYVPPLNTFISDSGKLAEIDKLLKRLKEEGHRVLIYFQMTRMMDLFEEYLVKREYSYLRLDGTSKISQRKELVDEWQKNSDVFIFILSTRAGGVGINLTAADTVVFYDSDWNPTVDQQAMDRVHRLGQTKDVVVYRFLVRDSIEERVMEKANRKDEMQKIVIKGNVFEGSFLE